MYSLFYNSYTNISLNRNDYSLISLRCVIPDVCVTNGRKESVVNQHEESVVNQHN